MSNKPKTINYTDNDRALVATLKGQEPMTLAQINEASGMNFLPGHIVSAMRKNLIVKTDTITVLKPATRPVSTFVFVTSDIQKKADGKDWGYTDSEREVLAAAAKIDSPFTLAQLSEAVGHKLFSGSINSLVKKGNLSKGEDTEVEYMAKSKVNLYAFNADIPAE
jgi:hypothetical protein